MQIPLKWINELVNIEAINLNDLIDKLTLGGFEVEEILELEIENEKQISLDISATANRSDSLSIQGISKEIATLLNQSTIESNYLLKKFELKNQLETFAKEISNDQNCSTLISIIIKNVTNFTSPKWIKQKLISSGLTPLDNLIDFQNYILLETGYPLAFYDYDKICSELDNSKFTLSCTKAKTKQKILASNDLTYHLMDSNLILKANNLPIGIAGIIEDKNYSCSTNTTSLLVEASIFDAATIRQQSRTLGLRTDRSARYEKSLNDIYLIESLYRIISLLRLSNPDLNCQLQTFVQVPKPSASPILLHYQTVNEILGPVSQCSEGTFSYITHDQITDYLNRLNFKFLTDQSNLIWEVQIPSDRSDDITREIDLIEEIGRLHGFNNFLTALPKIKTIGHEDISYQTRKKITSCFLNLGFNELIHYSLVNEKTFVENEIKLINPLLSDCASLRSSLLPNLIKTVQENLKQGNSFIEGFEYGHVFSKNKLNHIIEKEYVAGIFGGIKKKLTWSDSERVLSWFEAKGKIEQFFDQLNFLVCWRPSLASNNLVLHPYRNAELYLTDGTKFGTFGQIHPILANQLDLSSDIYLFELDMELIQAQLQQNKLILYKEYSSYPKIIKDLSFIIKQDIPFETLQKVLYSNGTKFLSEINLLDEYRGSSIPDDCTSLCLQFVFQSKEKTLENKDIEMIVKNLQSVLTNKFDVIVRS